MGMGRLTDEEQADSAAVAAAAGHVPARRRAMRSMT